VIEAVHHACRAGAYDEAWSVYWERIDQAGRGGLTWLLGAWETDVALMQEFFPGGDTSQEPQVSDPRDKSWILNEVGLCLMSLGRLGEAGPFFERKTAMQLDMEDWHNASIGNRSLASLHAHLGALAASADAAREALALARRAENKWDERCALYRQAWVAHLRGDLTKANATFQQAETLEREVYPSHRYLAGRGGIQHADHLRRMDDIAYARRVTDANRLYAERNRFSIDLSPSHRVLGDLDADALRRGSGQAGQHDSARTHYDQGLKIARGITRRDVLIEALLARGCWAARLAAKDPKGLRDPSGLDPAFSDLNEALGYAVDGGYRIYEADIRVALAWAHLAAGNPTRTREEAERAQRMSADMGYHWGQVDAAEALAAVRQHAENS